MDAINQDSIRKAFRCCGIAENGEKVPENELNSRLQAFLVLSADAKGIIPVFDQDPFQGVEAEVDDDEDLSENEEVLELETGGFPMVGEEEESGRENSDESDGND